MTNISLLDINFPELKVQLEKLKGEKKKLEDILEVIKKDNTKLKEDWDTMTSESVFNNFEDMYKGLTEIINDFNKDILYLEGIIKDYEAAEALTSKEIDENIAI